MIAEIHFLKFCFFNAEKEDLFYSLHKYSGSKKIYDIFNFAKIKNQI